MLKNRLKIYIEKKTLKKIKLKKIIIKKSKSGFDIQNYIHRGTFPPNFRSSMCSSLLRISSRYRHTNFFPRYYRN